MSYVDKGEDIGRDEDDGYLFPTVRTISKTATITSSYKSLREEPKVHDENSNDNTRKLDLSDLSKYVLTWEEVEGSKQKQLEDEKEKIQQDGQMVSSDATEEAGDSPDIGNRGKQQQEGEVEGGEGSDDVCIKEEGETFNEKEQQQENVEKGEEEEKEQKPRIRPAKVENEELEIVRHKLLAASYVTGGSDLGKLFNEIDTDGDGVISLEELTHTVTRLVPDMTDAKLFTIMKVADSKGTGVLDKEDFYWFVGHTKPPLEDDKNTTEELIAEEGKGEESKTSDSDADAEEGKREEKDEEKEEEKKEEDDHDEGPCRCYNTLFLEEPFMGKVVATNNMAPWKTNYNDFLKNKQDMNDVDSESKDNEGRNMDSKGVDNRWYSDNNRRLSSSRYDDTKGSNDDVEMNGMVVILETMPMAEKKKPQMKGEDGRKGLLGDKASYDGTDSDSKHAAADSK